MFAKVASGMPAVRLHCNSVDGQNYRQLVLLLDARRPFEPLGRLVSVAIFPVVSDHLRGGYNHLSCKILGKFCGQ